MVPSVVSLGQWLPIRALPGDLCRWRAGNENGVALTFDDGPDPRTTPFVLDRLDQLSLRATFFCLGQQVVAHPTLVGEMRARGHQVETHGFRHDHHFARSPRWVRADLDAAMEAMGQVGVHPRWFRPPFGQTTGATMVEARRHDLRLVLWSAWGREWDEPDAGAVARRVRRGIGPGGIVLLHDADVQSPPGSSRRAAEALGPIAEDLNGKGLAALTLDELVGPPR
jgi:peptidoglycan/xylan/chitin deacetylase (PgdA/CDA1 family)